MKVGKLHLLVIGGGAREHAIAKELQHSPQVAQVYCAPGNPGMTVDGIRPVAIEENDFDGLITFVQDHAIDWTVVGPEDALCAGIVDRFHAAGLKILGPTAEAAQLEGSKEFALKFMHQHHVPTAQYHAYTDLAAAKAGLAEFALPVVIKADGLAGGKGVTIAQTATEAEQQLEEHFAHGDQKVVLEEYLAGPEYSLFLLVNGNEYCLLPLAQDHKRAFDGDQGPNTGGMGAYSPLPQLQPDIVRTMKAEVVTPTIAGLVAEGFDYHGILYIGAVLTRDGAKVIEYNVRLGDPETQVILPRIETDLVDLFAAAINGTTLPSITVSTDAYLGITLAANGYPQSPVHGQTLPAFPQNTDVTLDYANVAGKPGTLTGAGGRLVTVIGHGPDVMTAQKRAYAYLDKLTCPQCFYRKDIGFRATGKTME
ncbi:phosphoribosylamine--glycine ligase [Ligilactobacillus sp. LYQ60]|uniref:phosphoribosylamine--glycine ligase n=1 Tax=unclassified Ligilactobacillus TaxID=2767920 RepID=UPI003853D2AF